MLTGLVEDEADLLPLASRSSKDGPEVLVKVVARVLVRHLDLEDAQSIHPRDEAGESGLEGEDWKMERRD